MLNRTAKYLHISFLLSLTLFIYSCAHMVMPSGGDKDVTPPFATEYEPKNYDTSFVSKKIKITFNEYVSLDDVLNQVVVSPPTKKEFDFNIRSKSLVIDVPDSLRDSTTYTIYFGQAIKDITEGNILSGFEYAFSTGKYIDSMSIRGKIVDAYTLEPVNNILVMAYMADNDSAPISRKPDYLTKSNASGLFLLNNLKNVPYKLFCLADLNSDMIYNLPNEKIAFADSMIIPQFVSKTPPSPAKPSEGDSTISGAAVQKKDTATIIADSAAVPEVIRTVEMHSFTQEDTVQRIMKSVADIIGQFRLYFKKPVSDMQLNVVNRTLPDGWRLDEWCKTRDTVYCWLTDLSIDTLKITVFDNGNLIDTVDLTIKQKPVPTTNTKPSGKGKGSAEKEFKLDVKLNVNPGGMLPYYMPLTFKLSHPDSITDFSKIKLEQKIDSTLTSLPVNINTPDSHVIRRFNLNYKWEAKKNYVLTMLPGAFTDIYGLVNDTMIVNFTSNSVESYGQLFFTFKSKVFDNPYILLLFNENKKVVAKKTVVSQQQLIFINLVPGNYTLRIIEDINRDGRWNPGNYHRNQQPEPTFMFPGSINIRANWDTDFEFMRP